MSEEPAAEFTAEMLETTCELLAAGELSPIRRRELFDFLEQNPEHWRICAIAFWDAQSFSTVMRQSTEFSATRKAGAAHPANGFSAEGTHREPLSSCAPRHPANHRVAPTRNHEPQPTNILGAGLLATENLTNGRLERALLQETRKMPAPANKSSGLSHKDNWQRLTAWGSTAALFFIGLMIAVYSGWSWGQANRLLQVQHQIQREQAVFQWSASWLAQLSAERESFRSLASFFPDQAQLIEIENTADRVVFLTDRPLSTQMVKWLVDVNGQVQVRPYKPEINSTLWQTYRNPVLEIEVSKLSSLSPN